MDAARFDALLRSLARAPTRRDLGRSLARLVLGGVLGSAALEEADTKKKGKKKRKKKRKPAPACIPDCADKVCGPDGCRARCQPDACDSGFGCDEDDGRCACASGITCNNGSLCCGIGFVCSDPEGGPCECPAPRVACHGVCCEEGEVCAADTDTCSPPYRLVTTWGERGSCGVPGEPACDESFDDKFGYPTGIAQDADSNVFVTDAGNCRVLKFTSSGTFITTWGAFGQCGAQGQPACDESFDGKFNFPIVGIEVAGDGTVYVCDRGNHRIQAFAENALNPDRYDFVTKWGTLGSNDGQFANPSDVALGSDSIFVADGSNHRVQEFDSTHTFVDKWGEFGRCGEAGEDPCDDSFNGQFDFPVSIAGDATGNYFYVVDGGNHRVQKFDSGGTFLDKWGAPGTAAGQFMNPGGIALDGAGNVFVVDQANNRVQKFAGDGTFILQWGAVGSGDGQFSTPFGVVVAADGHVYVADSENYRVQVFEPTPVAAPLRESGRVDAERNDRAPDQRRSRGTGRRQARGRGGPGADAAAQRRRHDNR